MFSDIMHGIMITMSPDCLLALCIGAMFGTVVGALPGLGTAVAITICIPFTLQMGNASAIALLLGVYATSIYGGSISAVLLNTPGTPQSACTGSKVTPWPRRAKRKRPSAGSPCPPSSAACSPALRWSSPPPSLRICP